MRISPSFLAVLTAAAALGFSNPVRAQSVEVDHSGTPPGRTQVPDRSVQRAERLAQRQAARERQIQAISAPETTGVEFLSQTPGEPPLDRPSDPGTPPAGTATPEQETPNEIQFGVDEAPEIDIETDPALEQPAPEVIPETEQPDAAPPGVDQPPTTEQPAAEEPRVLVSEVVVSGAEGDLLNEVYEAIQTQPGRTTTRTQLQQDINAIFATGFFSNVRATPEDTPLGVRVTFEVQPNPVLQSVQLSGSALETIRYQDEEVPIQQAVDGIFGEQYGQILDLNRLQDNINELNQLYQDNGYVLAQVIAVPQVSPDGTVTLEVAEGVVEDIQIRFLNEEGQATDEEGNPIEGQTREFIITREFETQPGDVFNRDQIQQDLRRAFDLGIFEDLQVALEPGTDPRQVDVTVNVVERQTGTFGAGVGLSTSSGLFGSVSFQEQNLGGNNQQLAAEVQLGERDILFDVSFTDPWIATDPNRTSYTVNAFGRRSISLIFDGGEEEVRLANGDRPRVGRLGGGVTFGRPLSDDWRASLGLQYQRVTLEDQDGEVTPRDEFGNLLSFNEDGTDDLITLQFSAARDRRNSQVGATSGSLLRLSSEQSIPLGDGNIFFNRIRASYSYYIPIRLFNFTEGCQQDNASPTDCPQTLAFNVQGGTVIGDLPPYEAFSLGGTDSVRGYGSGDVGAGRSFVQATAEYRFPLFSVLGGALFVDFGSDLGTGDDVPGDPAGIRDKPGTGIGYGAGLRVQSPLGQIRVDYGIGDGGDGRFHFGIGERF